MPTTEEQFKYECWAIVQELDPEDIADAIGDSVALVEASKQTMLKMLLQS